MKLSVFIRDNMDAIVADWEDFARTLPAAQGMSTLALRDHSREILLAIASDMELRQSVAASLKLSCSGRFESAFSS